MVLDTVPARTSKLVYGNAIDQLFRVARGRPLTRAVVMEFRASLDGLAPSTANADVGRCASWSAKPARTDIWGSRKPLPSPTSPTCGRAEPAGGLAHPGAGAQPDRSTLKGKRDYAILAGGVKKMGEALSDWDVRAVVEQAAGGIRIECFGPMICDGPVPSSADERAGTSSSAWTPLHPDNRTVPRVRAGDRCRGE